MPYDSSRGWFLATRQTFESQDHEAAATRWIGENARARPSSEVLGAFLFVGEFDPHEPFDTPEPWASMYDPDWEGPHLIWPPYVGATAATARNPRSAAGAADPQLMPA